MESTLTAKHKSERVKAILFLIISAVLWSSSGILIKLVNWNPVAIAGSRSAIAALVMLAFIRKPKINWSGAQVGGAFSYAATVILFVIANKLTTSANAILLQYTAPIFVAILSAWLLKEKVRAADWTAIVFVIAGMLLFFMDEFSGGRMLGNILAIVSGVSMAFMTIFLRMQKDGSPIESTFLGNILTAIIAIPFMVGPMPDFNSLIGILLLGVFQIGISYMFYTYAVKHVTALEAILIPIIEPILNPIWVFLIAGEIPGVWAFAGGAVVLVSVTLRCVYVALKPLKESGQV